MSPHVIPFPRSATIGRTDGESTRGKAGSRMIPTKRSYGSGCLLKRGKGWAIRWRETEIAPDGTKVKVLRYEGLGAIFAQGGGRTAGRKDRDSWHASGAAVARPVPHDRGTVGGVDRADVQTVDPEESSAHRAQASVAAIWRHADRRHDAAGDPGVHRVAHRGWLRAENDRSHSRRVQSGPVPTRNGVVPHSKMPENACW